MSDSSFPKGFEIGIGYSQEADKVSEREAAISHIAKNNASIAERLRAMTNEEYNRVFDIVGNTIGDSMGWLAVPEERSEQTIQIIDAIVAEPDSKARKLYAPWLQKLMHHDM